MESRLEKLSRENLEELRRTALATQNSILYAGLCSYLGVPPEDSDLVERGETDILMNQIPDEVYINEALDRQYQVYKNFVDRARTEGIMTGNIFADTSKKRTLLKECLGYNKLKVRGGRQDIEFCSPEIIGRAFQNCIKNAKKFIEDYER